MKKLSKPKKIAIIVIGVLVVAVSCIIYRIVSPFISTPKEVTELNNNLVLSEFPYKLGDEMRDFDLEKLKKMDEKKVMGTGRYLIITAI